MRAMLRAIELSRIGLKLGGPFGAVITKENEIIGEGVNTVVIRRDPTAHAEIVAIRDACRFLKTHDLQGCVLYSSCEPCVMCWGAVHWSRLDKVYYAATREDAAKAGFDDEEFYLQLALKPQERSTEFIPVEDKQAACDILKAWEALDEKRTY